MDGLVAVEDSEEATQRWSIDNIRPMDWKLNKRHRSQPRFAPLVL